jgi:hypothetical protein
MASRALLLLLKLDGNNDSDEIPMPTFPERSAFDRIDERTAPVFGSMSVKHPPPPPGVNVEDGLVVVMPITYFILQVNVVDG